jgi:hypothetical protein
VLLAAVDVEVFSLMDGEAKVTGRRALIYKPAVPETLTPTQIMFFRSLFSGYKFLANPEANGNLENFGPGAAFR